MTKHSIWSFFISHLLNYIWSQQLKTLSVITKFYQSFMNEEWVHIFCIYYNRTHSQAAFFVNLLQRNILYSNKFKFIIVVDNNYINKRNINTNCLWECSSNIVYCCYILTNNSYYKQFALTRVSFYSSLVPVILYASRVWIYFDKKLHRMHLLIYLSSPTTLFLGQLQIHWYNRASLTGPYLGQGRIQDFCQGGANFDKNIFQISLTVFLFHPSNHQMVSTPPAQYVN